MNTTQINSAKESLLFIPDISGFTKFVNNTEVTHSQHIIEELLEILIDSNEIGLEVSEIEGDAILFYREGKAPTSAEMLMQVQRMFVNFHAHLKKYETHRICQCGACSTANNLTLKFVAHFGEISMKQVKEHSKLFGRDVIVAHRLMKNNIDSHEYALFTNPLINACSNWVNVKQVAWAEPTHAEETYDVGTVKFCHLPMEPLYNHIPEPRIEDYNISGVSEKIMGVEKVIEAPIETTFNVIADLGFRHQWMESLKGSDKLNHKITQGGSTHRCIISGKEDDPFHIAHDFKVQDDMITFAESDHKQKIAMVITLRRIGNGLTQVKMHHFSKPNFFTRILFNLMFKKKYEAENQRNFDALNEYCKKLVAEGKDHPNQIVLNIEKSQVA